MNTVILNRILMLVIYVGMVGDALPMKQNDDEASSRSQDEKKWIIKGYKPEKEPIEEMQHNVSSYPEGHLKWDKNRNMYYYGNSLPLERRKQEDSPPPIKIDDDMVVYKLESNNERISPPQGKKEENYIKK